MRIFDRYIKESVNERLAKLEAHLSSDIVFFYGSIVPPIDKMFRDFIEKLKSESIDQQRVTIFLTTHGGLAETVEKMVDIIRFHYQEVYFVVPDYAMSAGTIFCMSGNKIFMDYSSSLGPIDPQVFTGKDYASALGYLDQVEKMIEKSKKGELTDAEFIMFEKLDLAMLSSYEQAKNLTITLLKKWLVQYKFANWGTHATDPRKKGKPVTTKEKEKRAEEIAKMLSDNKLWHSHGRMIGINTLTNLLRLKIDDYSNNTPLRTIQLACRTAMLEYIQREKYTSFLHSKNFF
ncbi:MAG: serine dehydrogenasease [Deltaproteobacteria bacterium]|nr:serine dehydrogenasease [Deltaproteobacteria bacterium]